MSSPPPTPEARRLAVRPLPNGANTSLQGVVSLTSPVARRLTVQSQPNGANTSLERVVLPDVRSPPQLVRGGMSPRQRRSFARQRGGGIRLIYHMQESPASVQSPTGVTGNLTNHRFWGRPPVVPLGLGTEED